MEEMVKVNVLCNKGKDEHGDTCSHTKILLFCIQYMDIHGMIESINQALTPGLIFFIPNSSEHEISTAYKTKMLEK